VPGSQSVRLRTADLCNGRLENQQTSKKTPIQPVVPKDINKFSTDFVENFPDRWKTPPASGVNSDSWP